jgi:hypothetical protein
MINNHDIFIKKYKIDKAPLGTKEYDANLFIDAFIDFEI